MTGTLSARLELPCFARLNGAGQTVARGVTEQLSRKCLVVVLQPDVDPNCLRTAANLTVGVELPYMGVFGPRVLECATTVTRVSEITSGTRVTASVHRMKVVDSVRQQPPDQVACGNHSGNFKLSRAEAVMTPLRNLFIEEDGQDMVEYGLVIAMVVLAAVALLTAFRGSLSTGFGAMGTDMTTNIK